MADTLAIIPRWLDLAHAARYASMHRKTLLKYVLAGEIYGTRKAGKWFLDVHSIDAFFEADKVLVARLTRKGV